MLVWGLEVEGWRVEVGLLWRWKWEMSVWLRDNRGEWSRAWGGRDCCEVQRIGQSLKIYQRFV